MQAKLEGDTRFKVIKDDSDVIELLKLIHDIAYDAEADRYPFMAQVAALKRYLFNYQKYATMNNTYFDSFNNLKEVFSHCGLELGKNQVLCKYILKKKEEDPETTDIKLIAETNDDTKNAFKAIVFLTGLNTH